MKIKIKKNFYIYLLLFLLIIVSIIVNLNWIKNDERPIGSEDEQVFGNSLNLYLGDTTLVYNILHLSYPPFIPSLIYISFKIFGPSFDSALYVNLLFWPVLVLSCFFLGKKLYNEKVGLLAMFILSTLPPIIIFSRTTYDQFILVSLITLNLALFAYSDYFKNRFFSLLYGLSFGLCLLTRYTSLPYIIVPPFFFILFKLNIIKKLFSFRQSFKTKFKIKKQNIIIIAIKIIISLLIVYLIVLINESHLSNAFFIIIILTCILTLLIIFTKKSVINNFLDSMIIAFLTTMILYANKIAYIINIYSPQFTRFTSVNMLSIIENTFIYIIFMVNNQLGFLNFLILLFAVIFLSIKYYKQRRIDEYDLLFFFVFLIPYVFYTFIPIKNTTVTTSLLIPVSFIMAKGILESPKIIKVIFLVVVIAGGLFYLIPIKNFNTTLYVDLNRPLWIEAVAPLTRLHKINEIKIFSKEQDISLKFSKDSRFSALKDQQQIKEISKIIYNILDTKNLKRTKIFFLYNDFYIFPHVLNCYLRLMNISLSSFSYHLSNFYDQPYVPTNISYIPHQEAGFEWVYDFDFLIVPALDKKIEPHFSFYSKNYYAIYSYLSNSKKFKKNFKLVYQSNVSDKKVVQLYERVDIN